MTRDFKEERLAFLANPVIGTWKNTEHVWPTFSSWPLVDIESEEELPCAKAWYQHTETGQIVVFNAMPQLASDGEKMGFYSMHCYGQYVHGNWRLASSIKKILQRLAGLIPQHKKEWLKTVPKVKDWNLVAADDTELVYQAQVGSSFLSIRFSPLIGDTALFLSVGGPVDIIIEVEPPVKEYSPCVTCAF